MLKLTLKLLICANILTMGHGAYADFCADQAQACETASSPSLLPICVANSSYCTSSPSLSGNKWNIPIWPDCQTTSPAACTPSYQLSQTLFSLLGGSFGNTCKDCNFGAGGEPILSCRCYDEVGRHADTTLDVSTCTENISNCSASLTCGSCSGSSATKKARKKTVSTKKK
jgi:hypothetical protein